jgi:hypothetical protein
MARDWWSYVAALVSAFNFASLSTDCQFIYYLPGYSAGCSGIVLVIMFVTRYDVLPQCIYTFNFDDLECQYNYIHNYAVFNGDTYQQALAPVQSIPLVHID